MDNSIDLLIKNMNKKVLFLVFFLLLGFDLYAQRQAPLQILANIQESSCASQGHVISVKVKGGEEPYTYRWKDGATGSFRKDLKSGVYVCEVQDAKGNKVSKTFSLTALPSPLELKYDLQKSAQGTNSIYLKVAGGVPPYTYFWIGQDVDFESTHQKDRMEGLKNGIYRIVVQDSNECTANVTVDLK